MEFVATIEGQKYRFSYLNKNSFLISGNQCEYIVYKTKEWKCADEITSDLLETFGEVIEEHLTVRG